MNRYLIIRLSSLMLLLGLVLPSFPACGMGIHAYSATYFDETFDTVLSITVGAENAAEANTHCRAIKDMVSHLHRQFDAYTIYPGLSNIATINAAETGTPVTVSADVMSLLKLGQEMYARTDGSVHIGLGAVTTLWKNAIVAAKIPESDEIAAALATAQTLDHLVMDEPNNRVTLTAPGMKLDVGSIAKGYVLHQVRVYAETQGISSLLCNLGGEILAVGSAPNGEAWEIAIAAPDGGTLETVRVSNVSIATGGDYERGFDMDGKRYHHIIDPQTGRPAETHRAATVILPIEQTVYADAYSTALIILPPDRGSALITPIANAAYLSILPDGTVNRSDGWKAYAS